MPIDPSGIAAGQALRLGPALIKQWRNHDEVRKLRRLLDSALKKSHDIPRAKRKRVRKKVKSLRVDPDFLGCIRAYVEDGDMNALVAMRARLGQLIDFRDPEIDDNGVINLVIKMVEDNVVRAKRDERGAMAIVGNVVVQRQAEQQQQSTRELSELIDESFREQREYLDARDGDRRERLERSEQRHAAEPDALTSQGSIEGTGEDTVECHLTRLAEADAVAGQRVHEAWNAGGSRALDRLLEHPPSWLQDASAAVWDRLGRILLLEGRFALAEQAFLDASERDPDDPVREVMRAFQAAQIGSRDSDRAGELLARAEAMDGGSDHPAVLIAKARERVIDAAAESLALLQQVVPMNASDRANTEWVRAQALLAQGERTSASEAITRCLQIDPENPGAKELGAALVLYQQQDLFMAGQEVDADALGAAADEYLHLRAWLLERHRYEEAALMLARAGEAGFLAGGADEAMRRLTRAELTSEEMATDGAPAVARIAVLAGQPKTALQILPAQPRSAQGQLVRAQALTRSTDRETRNQGVAELRRLLRTTGDDELRQGAAFGLLDAAARDGEVEWSGDAAQIVAAEDPAMAAILEANHLQAAGDVRAAENVLLRRSDDSEALRSLIELAIAREDWQTAVDRSESLMARDPRPGDRFNHGQILHKLDLVQDARQVFSELARDAGIPLDLRERAYGRCCDLAGQTRDFTAMAHFAGEWCGLQTDSDDARWTQILALARLARQREALELVDRHALQPQSLNQALLAAEVLYRAAETVEAVRRISELSDRFGREEETLEALVLLAAVRRKDPLPDELVERVREGFETFPQKFPDSQIIWTVPAPTTAAEFDQFAANLLAGGTQVVSEAEQGVIDGETPVAALAAAVNKDLITTWTRLRVLPLGYGDTTLDDAERSDAVDAIGTSAVWDPSTLYVVGGLGEVGDVIRGALPGSVVSQATVDDADQASTAVQEDQDELQEIGYDPMSGQAVLRSWDKAATAQARAASTGAIELARKLKTVPNADPESIDDLDRLLTDEKLNPALATWASAFAVARRTGQPIFSDDRFIRFAARRDGLHAFGTVALLEALVDRGLSTAAQRDAARTRLLNSGAWGTRPAAEALIELGRQAGWDITAGLSAALNDRSAWRADLLKMWRTVEAFLQAVFVESPQEFDAWTARVIDAAANALPDRPVEAHVHALLVTAWRLGEAPPTNSDRFLQALIASLRRLPLFLRPLPHDPLVHTMNRLLQATGPLTPSQRVMFFWRWISRLRATDQFELWKIFAR